MPITRVDPAPARALHADLLSRFNTLSGQGRTKSINRNLESEHNDVELFGDEDGRTVEDLLAELGPEESWQVGKSEEDDIDNLLKTAKATLGRQTIEEPSDPSAPDNVPGSSRTANDATSRATINSSHGIPEQPEPTEDELDGEADEYLAQILEEIKHAPKSEQPEPQREIDTVDPSQGHFNRSPQPTDSLPSAPVAEPDPPSYSDITADDALASRFANLSLPSVPTAIKPPSSQPPAARPQQPKGFTDEEIDSWCTICNEDATLSCRGCDGDLYCTSCWLDGHKGPDAGYEERTHKAVQYNKGGGLKKQPARRMVGA